MKHIDWSDEDIEELGEVSGLDVPEANAYWKDHAPILKNILEAEEEEPDADTQNT